MAVHFCISRTEKLCVKGDDGAWVGGIQTGVEGGGGVRRKEDLHGASHIDGRDAVLAAANRQSQQRFPFYIHT